MALSAKSEELKHVPWFSLSEWHQVYKQLYSNDVAEQGKAYQTLLVWKARTPKLPVGVENTLALIQVCLRDREWTPKISEAKLPTSYENDLCLMYSTTIMRFLNQICNVGHTKQTSMFQIAKQLKIPEWIVNLRHDTAHGYELPGIDAMRMAANVLLAWLHEEYWAAEAKAIEKRYEEPIENEQDEKSCESHALVVFFELWTAVSLYMKADYHSISELPDASLRRTLQNLCTVLPENPLEKETNNGSPVKVQNEDNYSLVDAKRTLFLEIKTLFTKTKLTPNIEDVVMGMLFNCEAFLPNSEIINIFMSKSGIFDATSADLPSEILEFWQDFIILLRENELLDELLWRLFNLVNSSNEDDNKVRIASLWINSICNSFLKLRIAQGLTQAMEHSLDDKNKRLSQKQIVQKVRNIVNKTNPELSSAMWLDTSHDIPIFLKDFNFVTDLLLNPNSFTKNFIHSVIDLVASNISSKYKDYLLKLVKIQTRPKVSEERSAEDDQVYSLEDLKEICSEQEEQAELQIDSAYERSAEPEIADRTIRNENWRVASGEYNWAACPFGILPWQIETLELLEPGTTVQVQPLSMDKRTTIIPGLLDSKLLTMESRVNWDNVLRQKKRLKRKRQDDESQVMVDRAIDIVKNRKK